MPNIRCIALVLAVAIVPSLADAQLTPRPGFSFKDNSAQLAASLDKLAGDDNPGFAVVVLRGEQVLMQKCAGVASVKTGEPITPETMFYTASVGKTFTSAAILKLFEAGKVKLSDPLSTYLPDAPPVARGIAIHHLLNHTSGLPDYYDALGEDVASLSNADVLAFAAGVEALDFEPGTDYAYSNTAYVLLAMVVEKVSGTSFADYLAEAFLVPLGMTSTVVFDERRPAVRNRAVGYARKDGKFVESDYTGITVTGSGGMYSTIGDMQKWMLALRSGKVLKPRTLEMALRPPFTLNGSKSYMAMGWFDETFGSKTPELEGLVAYAAIGQLRGYSAIMEFFPDADLAYVLLSNVKNFPLLSENVASTYLQRER